MNALGIGATSNARNRANDPQYDPHWSCVIATGRVGQLQLHDAADAVLFLVSLQAAMIHGYTLMLGGKRTLRSFTSGSSTVADQVGLA
ncbi:hypothetical protein [Deinococcus hohokamensis]|uniref:Uncharacterized protein n=1 Tax=Deinococcus hohokamensis TaxID=309883 RepID=A0ABV9I650_9DEIO